MAENALFAAAIPCSKPNGGDQNQSQIWQRDFDWEAALENRVENESGYWLVEPARKQDQIKYRVASLSRNYG
jgi:hypothetical protein